MRHKLDEMSRDYRKNYWEALLVDDQVVELLSGMKILSSICLLERIYVIW